MMIYDNFAFPDFRKELIHPGREIFVRIRAIASDTTGHDTTDSRTGRAVCISVSTPRDPSRTWQSCSQARVQSPNFPHARPRAPGPGHVPVSQGPVPLARPPHSQARAQPRKALSFRRFGLQFQILKPQPLYASPQPNRILWWNFQGALVGGALLLLYIVDAAVG